MQADAPPPVKNPPEGLKLLTEVEPRFFLGDPMVGVAGVAQYEKIEAGAASRFRQRLIHGSKPLENAVGVLVINRHDNGGGGQGISVRLNFRDADPGRVGGAAQKPPADGGYNGGKSHLRHQ